MLESTNTLGHRRRRKMHAFTQFPPTDPSLTTHLTQDSIVNTVYGQRYLSHDGIMTWLSAQNECS